MSLTSPNFRVRGHPLPDILVYENVFCPRHHLWKHKKKTFNQNFILASSCLEIWGFSLIQVTNGHFIENILYSCPLVIDVSDDDS